MRSRIFRANDDIQSGSGWMPHAVFASITGLLAFPILSNLGNWGIRDWDLFTTLQAAAVKSLVEYGQFPFWNPYIGGGNILFAHPEVSVLNPLFILQLVFGGLIGLKLQLLVSYYIGFIGSYKLSRKLGISSFGSYIPPLVFMLSSYFTLHFSAGHLPFHYFSMLPWLFLFYLKSKENPIHIFSIGGIVAFMVLGSGAAIPLLMSLFFLFLYSLFDINRADKFRYPLYAIAGGACGILFSAVKFFPMFDYLARNPWTPSAEIEVIPLTVLSDMFLSFNQWQYGQYAGKLIWEWHEYSAFIGPIVLTLAIIAAIYKFKSSSKYLVLSGISLLIGLGSFIHPWSPWDLLNSLPGFESMRTPSRFFLLFVFSVSIMAGFGIDLLLSFFKYRKGALTMILFVSVVCTHFFVTIPVLMKTFVRTPQTAAASSDFRQIEGDPNKMYAALLANKGTIRAAWVSAYKGGRAIFDGKNLQEWHSDYNKVIVNNRTFSPNRISYDVKSAREERLVISQGYDPGWYRTDGQPIEELHNLVALKVPPGESTIEIVYRPGYFYIGLFVSVMSIFGALFLAKRFTGISVKTDCVSTSR